jgi:hypothetical protein
MAVGALKIGIGRLQRIQRRQAAGRVALGEAHAGDPQHQCGVGRVDAGHAVAVERLGLVQPAQPDAFVGQGAFVGDRRRDRQSGDRAASGPARFDFQISPQSISVNKSETYFDIEWRSRLTNI